MALIKANFTAHGQFGGVYFHTDRAGLHIAAMPRSIRKASMEGPIIYKHSPRGSRAMYILIFTAMTTPYKQLIKLGLALAWALAAQAYKYYDRNGDQVKLTVWSLFLHFNMPRAAQELPPYSIPPEGLNNLPDFVGTGRYFSSIAAPFYQAGEYNGRPWYRSAYEGYGWTEEPTQKKIYMWWNGDFWYISRTIGDTTIDRLWVNYGTDPEGTYEPKFQLDREIVVTR
jgi:hypothetical protein